jgi:hypothetical protein
MLDKGPGNPGPLFFKNAKLMLDPAKLIEISRLMCEIPCDAGRNFITVTFYPGMCSGYFEFLFNWKCDKGEVSFNSLDDAIQKLLELRMRVQG